MNEPGSRMVQQAINNCQDPQLVLAVLRWLEQNIQEVVLAKPSVHLALVVLESLGSLAAERNNQVWAGRLDKFILHLVDTEVRSDESYHVMIFVIRIFLQDLIATAALHPTGYLLAKLVVSQLEVISEATRQEVLHCLAASVDLLRASKTGSLVLRALE